MRIRKQNEEHTVPVAVIQIVLSQWSKASRGGSAAVERNKMPEAFRLPPFRPKISQPSFVVQTIENLFVTVAETSQRTPHQSVIVQSSAVPFQRESVRVSLHDGTLHVDYDWTHAAGMPERYPKRDVLLLQAGQWGQLRYNERHSYESAWWYKKWVFNIGLFTTVSPGVFLRTEPTQSHSMMDHMR